MVPLPLKTPGITVATSVTRSLPKGTKVKARVLGNGAAQDPLQPLFYLNAIVVSNSRRYFGERQMYSPRMISRAIATGSGHGDAPTSRAMLSGRPGTSLMHSPQP